MKQIITKLAEYKELKGVIKSGKSAAVTGCPFAMRAAATATLIEELERPAVVVCADEGEALRFASDLTSFLGDGVFVLPARDMVFGTVATHSREYEHAALSVLCAAQNKTARAVVTTPEALSKKTLPPEILAAACFTLTVGQTCAPDAVTRRLSSAGYVFAEQIEAKGQFCLRGGILDIFPVSSSEPVRIEFFGDEIDTLCSFDIETQRRTDPLQSVSVSPATEIFPPDREAFANRLEDYCARQKSRAAADFVAKAEADLTALRENRRIDYQRYLNLLFEHPATVLDYLDRPFCVVQEYSRVEESRQGFSERYGAELTDAVGQHEMLKTLGDFYLSDAELDAYLFGCSVCFESFTKTALEQVCSLLIPFNARQLASYNGIDASIFELVNDYLHTGYTVLLCVATERGRAAVIDDALRQEIPTAPYEKGTVLQSGLYVGVAGISAGFDLPQLKFVLISTSTQNRGRRKSRQSVKNAVRSISELTPGDYVVHAGHGIGIYRGVQTIESGGATKDYIKLSYAGSDNLYLPVTQLDMLSKYIGPDEEGKVRLNKLGGSEWQKSKSRVRAAVKDMAEELIKLYAERQSKQGHAFGADTVWQGEFEQRFEFDETADQLRSIAEIKTDMEKATPMDRILCGDVGFGKTEVAIRAAFKAAMDGKQVAFLAPTTILALQHYETICRRMAGFGINTALLTRFVNQKAVNDTTYKISTGQLDIVVGTHKILQKDIKFARLGLIIIDEEQRFGVAHKEMLKKQFPTVDVLTLSATPIPRTLNMALSGLRDMSVLDEAPAERYPIASFVCEFNLPMLTDALRKELRRGGQAYWLHNRIDDISLTAAKIAKQIPEARVVFAHGQMDKTELSRIWQTVLDGEADVLVCTTIIESGIDLPNVNTIVIEDADALGLSQLHQIRGRVGRSTRRAYAYLTYKPQKALSEIATKRLQAIEQFTEFGSGINIAMRDMELRGAGNLLGAEQHGHLSSVGYDMYIKLLSEAVALAKGETPRPEVPSCLIDLPIDAYLPSDYIKSNAQRLEIYQRIAAITNESDALDVTDELIDRFGDPPRPVQNLMEVAQLRNLAASKSVTEISKKSDGVAFYLPPVSRETLVRLTVALRGRVMVSQGAKNCLYVKIGKESSAELVRTVCSLL